MKIISTSGMSLVKLVVIVLSLIAISLAYSRANAGSQNAVATFFENSERQIENKNQCYTLKLALIDMISKSPEQLKQRRYENHDGKANQWTVTELLSKHYTSQLGKTAFYEDYRKKPAKSAIAKQIQLLRSCGTYAEATAKAGGPSSTKDPVELDFDRLSPINSGR